MGIRPMVKRLYAGSLLRSETYTRLKRTRELIATLIVDGLESERGKLALARMAEAHRRVQASDEEYRYVLSVFFLEPLRFNALYGVKALLDSDRSLLFEFWMQAGQRMGISALPPSLAEWAAFQRDFEGEHLGHTPEGEQLALASLHDVVRLVIPRGLQGLTRQALLGCMDPAVRHALGLPRAVLPTLLSVKALRAVSVFGAGTRVPTLDARE
jgi:uncharacterized protein (DUF2236 family)